MTPFRSVSASSKRARSYANDSGCEVILRMSLEPVGRLGGARVASPQKPPIMHDIPTSIDVPALPLSQRGHLWHLGDHRLLCGNATNPAHVAKALAGATPQLMVTEPHYRVAYDPEWRDKVARAGLFGRKRIGTGAPGKVANDHRADWRQVWALYARDVAYVWHGALHASTLAFKGQTRLCRFSIPLLLGTCVQIILDVI